MRNKPTTTAAERFLAKNPTFIGRVNEWDFYECPIDGDESPLIAITEAGFKRLTSEWELPSSDFYKDLY